jgi:kumamolisin
LLAALVARLNEALDAKIGYFNPLLYDMADSKAIKSITEGNNSMPDGPDAWQASKQGWDPCTGLGVPNGEEMLKWLKKNLK